MSDRITETAPAPWIVIEMDDRYHAVIDTMTQSIMPPALLRSFIRASGPER
jgi:polyphosphate kinase 2 (PPK2 family)